MLPDVALLKIFDFYISELRIEPVKYRFGVTRICSLAAKPEHW